MVSVCGLLANFDAPAQLTTNKSRLCQAITAFLFTAFATQAEAQSRQESPFWSHSTSEAAEVTRQSAGPSVLGTVALPAGTTPTGARWTRILKAPFETNAALAHIVSAARQLPPLQQAAFVQTAVNRAVHRRSRARCVLDDGYWASSNETLARGAGDCVDIAIAKMEALRLLGTGVGDLFLTMGRGRANDPLAVLLIRIGDTVWLLDDKSNGILEAQQSSSFKPTVTYGLATTWVHGFRVKIVPPRTTMASGS